MCSKRIGKYVVNMGQLLGKGSHSAVYRGCKEETQEMVAVKVINKTDIQRQTVDLTDLFKQIKVMQQLKSQNIIQFYDSHQTANNFYIFEEIALNGTLRNILQRQGALQEDTVVDYLSQILNGFTELIKNGIVHRDIKPENILLSQNILKIADFGFSHQSLKLSQMTNLLGTPIYMSPQILSGCKYSYKCDIWSIGIIAYEMVTGTWPWFSVDGNFLQEITTKKLIFNSKAPINFQLKQFIEGCLQIDEEKRFGWKDIFNHPLFEGKIKNRPSDVSDDESIKVGFIVAHLREDVRKDKAKARQILEGAPDNITSHQLVQIVNSISPEISLNAVGSIYLGCKKLFKNSSKVIQKEDFLAYLKKFKINWEKDSADEQIESCYLTKKTEGQSDKLKVVLLKKFKDQSLNLEKLFRNYVNRQSNKMSFRRFGCMVHSLDGSLQKEQLAGMFKRIAPNNNLEEKIVYKDFERYFEL